MPFARVAVVRSAWLVVLLVLPLACDAKDAPLEPACDAPKVAPSRGACFTGGACNPVTGAPCVDQACDHWIENGVDRGYRCVLTDCDDSICNETPIQRTDASLCSTCNADEGDRILCRPTLGCLTSGRCARYCCDDGDCGKKGRCEKEGVEGGVGVCLHSEDASEGT